MGVRQSSLLDARYRQALMMAGGASALALHVDVMLAACAW